MEFSLLSTWRDLVRRIAVLTGAGAGLLSLISEAPVHVAVTRGVVGYFGCLLIGRIGALAITTTSSRADRQALPEGEHE